MRATIIHPTRRVAYPVYVAVAYSVACWQFISWNSKVVDVIMDCTPRRMIGGGFMSTVQSTLRIYCCSVTKHSVFTPYLHSLDADMSTDDGEGGSNSVSYGLCRHCDFTTDRSLL